MRDEDKLLAGLIKLMVALRTESHGSCDMQWLLPSLWLCDQHARLYYNASLTGKRWASGSERFPTMPVPADFERTVHSMLSDGWGSGNEDVKWQG